MSEKRYFLVFVSFCYLLVFILEERRSFICEYVSFRVKREVLSSKTL